MHPTFREHQKCEGESLTQLQNFRDENPNFHFVGSPEYMQSPIHLGIDDNLTASYYIGADWLQVGKMAVVVLPKIPKLDYMEMFIEALKVDSYAEAKYFSQCYGINFNQPPIEVPEELNQLSVLLVIHYIALLENLVKNGIRKDYVTIEENLKAKVKGHLMVSSHLYKNIIPHREDRAYCRYQIYTEDIPVNRLLKKALLFAQQMLLSFSTTEKIKFKLQSHINGLLRRFEHISDDVSIAEVQNMVNNKLYQYYIEVVQIAKVILRRYDYSISAVSANNYKTPPFWIDMSRLYEIYVYSQLYKVYGSQIKFQVKGHLHTQVDYIHIGEKLIIDAKYKPRYDYSMSGIIADIREISGYARDSKILSHFNLTSNEEVRCLIIYPVLQFDNTENQIENKMSIEEQKELEVFITQPKLESLQEDLWASATNLPWFRNFKKLSIPLPILQ